MNDDICIGDSVTSKGHWFISFSLQVVLHRPSLLKNKFTVNQHHFWSKIIPFSIALEILPWVPDFFIPTSGHASPERSWILWKLINDSSSLKCIIWSQQFCIICKLDGVKLSTFCHIVDKDSRERCKNSVVLEALWLQLEYDPLIPTFWTPSSFFYWSKV